ncbi:MAG: hypothetical protein E3J73_04300 [Candidatus Bathyarchaeum sp.]|nr:MAG: hypothetical protein E3J73_04300 [Candidatus Bathyarchaeum sp.]
MDKILNNITSGTTLKTPSGRASFEVERIDSEGITLRVGTGWSIYVSKDCWEGIPDFLRGRGWVLIGATHGTPPGGSLDEYLQKYTHGTSAASYVVPILEKILLVQLDQSKPSKVRLIE